MSWYFRFLALAVVLLVSCLELVFCSSQPARPLKRLYRPSTLALEILPRKPNANVPSYSKRSSSPHSTTLLHSDSFRLTISAFGSDYFIHLHPNDHIVSPAARITYYHTDPLTGVSALSHTEPLLRESVRAYWGEVVPAHLSHGRMREDLAGLQRPGAGDLGWASIMVHHQGDVEQGIAPVFEGAFTVGGIVHHVMTKDNYFRNKHPLDPTVIHPFDDADPDSPLVIWRDSDVMSANEEAAMHGGAAALSTPHTCGHDQLSYNTDPLQNPVLQRPLSTPWYDTFGFSYLNGSLSKRQDIAGNTGTSNFAGSIGSSAGCPTSQKVLYMGVAADCQYTMQYGSQQNATMQILTDWNTASALYKTTFNVSLGIIELQVQNTTCPSTPDPSIPWNVDCTTGNVTLNDRLSLFSAWRGQKGNDGAGLWHLMSGCPTGTEVGIAWLGTLCQQSSSGNAPSVVSGTAVSTPGRTEWQVVAHETGHNFGAIHDCTSGCNSTTACCPLSSSTCDAGSQFIMNPVTEAGEMKFSECSLGNICSLMQSTTSGHTNTSCLLDPSQATKQTISLQMCGNGIVEAGEECDPGQGVNSTCCDSATCKFTAGSVCDPTNSACCTQSCSFAPSSQVCRPALDPQCDVAEMCTGNSSTCPANVVVPNGRSCGSGGLACASGQCTSVSQQCQTVGASMNLQQACPNQNQKSCQVSCVNPSQANSCVTLQSQLIDGSPCGYGGMCMSGNCKAGSILDTAEAWYKQNLQIAIPVTVVAGIIFIIILWVIVIAFKRRCCGNRNKENRTGSSEAALNKKRGTRLSSWGPGPAPPDMMEPPAGVIQPPLAAMQPSLVTTQPSLRALAKPLPTSREPPLILQPGSEAAFKRAPSRAQSSKSSVGSRYRNGQNGRSTRPQLETRPSFASSASNYSTSSTDGAFKRHIPPNPIAGSANNQPNWVDATLYNGLRGR